MRREDREVKDNIKIDEIIKKSKVCRIGFNDNGEVYIVPMNFGYVHENNRRIFYFHSAKSGRKMDLIEANPKVGFEIDVLLGIWENDIACACSAGFQSITGTGTIRELEDYESKKTGLIQLMNHMIENRDWKFDQKAVDAVSVFQLEVEKITCKEHSR